MTLQQQVQQHLASTGISLRELSRRSGVSHTTIGKILRGGTYKSDTAHALYSLISVTPISEYKTLDATVEQLAAQCIDSDLTHVRDDALECGKQRRIAALEAEVSVVREQRNKLSFACEDLTASLDTEKRNFAALEQVHEHVAGKLAKAEALTQVYSKDLQTMQASWKTACVRSEQLQKQLDHGQAVYSKLCSQLGATRTKYETQPEAANQKETRLQEQLAEVYAANMRQEAQVMRLRVYVWILIAAIVFLIVIGLALRGGV